MITFQSEAAGDVMMFADIGQRMMEIMGKESTERGVITVEQLPECIARLRAAITADRAQSRGTADSGDDEPTGMAARVSLAQRAIPLAELLERSLQRKCPVLWGV